jgi:DNA-binding CsgD family transcriptional regulator
MGRNESFTARELDVLRLTCEGNSNKEIASRLGISDKTIACNRYRCFEKAGVHSAVRLLRWAIKRGYVEVERPGDPPRGSTITARMAATNEGVDGRAIG